MAEMSLPKSASPSEPRPASVGRSQGGGYWCTCCGDITKPCEHWTRVREFLAAEPRRDEREEFEKWLTSFGKYAPETINVLWTGSGYSLPEIQSMWESWQASRASAALPQTAQIPEPLMQDLVIHVIEKFTGPTGGWLESPVAVCNELCDALKNWAVPQPSAGQLDDKCPKCKRPKKLHIPDAGKLACPVQSMDESVPIQYWEPSAGQREGK